jgi:hypothetical protein
MRTRDQEFEKAAAGTVADLRKFISMVAAMFQRKKAPGDPEDWEQDAALAVIEGIRKRGVTLTAFGSRTYHYRAASCAIAAGISGRLSVVRLGATEGHLARNFQNWEQIEGCNAGDESAVDIADGVEPLHFAERDTRRARAALMEIVARHVAQMPPEDRRALEPMLGIRTVEAKERSEAVAASGRSRQAVDAAVKRLGIAVRGDSRAVRARRMFLAT